MSGHQICVWAQMYTFQPRHDCNHTIIIITCQGTNVSDRNMCGHRRVWAQAPGHKSVWARTCLGTNVCGHKHVWEQTCGLRFFKRMLLILIRNWVDFFVGYCVLTSFCWGDGLQIWLKFPKAPYRRYSHSIIDRFRLHQFCLRFSKGWSLFVLVAVWRAVGSCHLTSTSTRRIWVPVMLFWTFSLLAQDLCVSSSKLTFWLVTLCMVFFLHSMWWGDQPVELWLLTLNLLRCLCRTGSFRALSFCLVFDCGMGCMNLSLLVKVWVLLKLQSIAFFYKIDCPLFLPALQLYLFHLSFFPGP